MDISWFSIIRGLGLDMSHEYQQTAAKEPTFQIPPAVCRREKSRHFQQTVVTDFGVVVIAIAKL